MKKILFNLFIIFSVFLFTISSAFAEIKTVADIDKKIISLKVIYNTDFTTFYNKTELIGNATDNFINYTENYKRSAYMTATKLENIKKQISELTGEDKSKQTALLFEAEDCLFEFDNKTFMYIESLRRFVPSITYQRYQAKFNTFYNSLNLKN